jgi:TatA/E family protein of Tat protein translocase
MYSFFLNFAYLLNTIDLRLLLFDFGAGEIMLVVLAVLLVFGPGKIPEIARNLGKFINEIKRASEDIKTEINREGDRIDREKRLSEYKESLNKDTEKPKEETVNDSQ